MSLENKVVLSKTFITSKELDNVFRNEILPLNSNDVVIHYDVNVKGVSIAFTKALDNLLKEHHIDVSYTADSEFILNKVMEDLVF